jgi:hypothetical protein
MDIRAKTGSSYDKAKTPPKYKLLSVSEPSSDAFGYGKLQFIFFWFFENRENRNWKEKENPDFKETAT